jgi:type IV pilus assembly protein PilW
MVTLGANSFSSPVAIAEGIETMQIEYGRDTDGDGAPDTWTVDPGLTGAAWGQVAAVKLHILARNTLSSTTFTDTRTYVLGSVASTDNTFGPFNDAYKRHAYTSVVRPNNVAGRME